MAIEFDIKVVRPITSRAVLEKTGVYLRKFGIADVPTTDEAMETLWGHSERQGTFHLGDVETSLMSHMTGEEADLGEDGGFWITVSASPSRTGAGVFVTAIIALAIADETGSVVVDESELFQLGRQVIPGEGLCHLDRTVGHGNLKAIGCRMASVLGLTSIA